MTDASQFALGAVLMQETVHGLQPVAYWSRKLKSAEENYTVHEQELLAIVDACKTWRHLLVGSEVTVYTDHNPIRYLWDQPDLSKRQARWINFLAEYDLTIQYVEGTKNVVADAFSRNPDYKTLNVKVKSLREEFLRRSFKYEDPSAVAQIASP